MWGICSCAARRCACVPLPAPGAPRKTSRIPLPATSFQPSLGQEPLVVAHEHVRLDLLRRVQAYADGDQQRGAAEVERHAEFVDQDLRDDADPRQVERACEGDAVQDPVDIVGGPLAGRMPGMNPPYFFMLSAISTGF